MDNGDKITRTMEYDPNTGRMLKGTDALGNATRVTYTSRGEVKTITDPLGNVVTLNYSPEGDLVSLKDPLAIPLPSFTIWPGVSPRQPILWAFPTRKP